MDPPVAIARMLVRESLELLLESLIFARPRPQDSRTGTAQAEEDTGATLRERLRTPG